MAGTTPVLVHNCGGGLLDRVKGFFGRNDPAPNAKVGDLRDIDLPDVGGTADSPRKMSDLSKLSAKDLLKSVFRPKKVDGERPYLSLNPYTGQMQEGNHRAAMLMAWARSNERNGGGGPISWDTPIYIRGFGS